MADKNSSSDTPPAEKDLPYNALDYTKDRKQIDELKAKALKHAEKEAQAFKMEDQLYQNARINAQAEYDKREKNSIAEFSPALKEANKWEEVADKRRNQALAALKERAGEVLKKDGLNYADDTHADPKQREFLKQMPQRTQMVLGQMIGKNTKMYADDIFAEMVQDIHNGGKKALGIEGTLPQKGKMNDLNQNMSRWGR